MRASSVSAGQVPAAGQGAGLDVRPASCGGAFSAAVGSEDALVGPAAVGDGVLARVHVLVIARGGVTRQTT